MLCCQACAVCPWLSPGSAGVAGCVAGWGYCVPTPCRGVACPRTTGTAATTGSSGAPWDQGGGGGNEINQPGNLIIVDVFTLKRIAGIKRMDVRKYNKYRKNKRNVMYSKGI